VFFFPECGCAGLLACACACECVSGYVCDDVANIYIYIYICRGTCADVANTYIYICMLYSNIYIYVCIRVCVSGYVCDDVANISGSCRRDTCALTRDITAAQWHVE